MELWREELQRYFDGPEAETEADETFTRGRMAGLKKQLEQNRHIVTKKSRLTEWCYRFVVFSVALNLMELAYFAFR